MKGHAYHGAIVEFGECVSVRLPGPIVHKMEPQWVSGVWLGKPVGNDEHIVATSHGVIQARCSRRRERTAKYDPNLIKQVQGVPWDIKRTEEPNETVPSHPSPPAPHVHQGATEREHKLKQFCQACGKTPGCRACHHGVRGNTHSAQCKRRR